jgi:aspartate aminotransferase
MRAAFEKRKSLCISLLNQIPGMKTNNPAGAFYIFPDISNYFGTRCGDYSINSADEFCDYLMMTVFVAVVPGSAFGAPNCFRLSYAASEQQLTDQANKRSYRKTTFLRNGKNHFILLIR